MPYQVINGIKIYILHIKILIIYKDTIFLQRQSTLMCMKSLKMITINMHLSCSWQELDIAS
jgi:hypothetical protein